MEGATRPLKVVRFGSFEVNFRARLLYTCGRRIDLQENSFQVLQLLVERADDLVDRAELRERLWPDTHVRFDSSLNTAINTLRKALGDRPDSPRFIETRTGRGYRFIAKIERPGVEMLPVSGEAIASIAVLPFRNVSGDPEEENLSDTIAESLLNRLSQLPQVRVVAWNTAIHYKTHQIDPQELGRKLSVHAILLGRVTQIADTLVVATELVNAQTGHHLWGEHCHYCRKLSGPAVQEEVSREISNKLSQWLAGLSRS